MVCDSIGRPDRRARSSGVVGCAISCVWRPKAAPVEEPLELIRLSTDGDLIRFRTQQLCGTKV